MGLVHEFKEFAVKGNVVDMAIGIIIGAAFGKIVSSLVADVITPPVGLLLGGVDFSDLGVTLKAAVGDQPAVVLKYGVFLQATFDFIIVAAAMFLVIKGMNRIRSAPKQAPAPEKQQQQEVLLAGIRDLIRAQSEERRRAV
jgi:large conductance mechanosensitive channel